MEKTGPPWPRKAWPPAAPDFDSTRRALPLIRFPLWCLVVPMPPRHLTDRSVRKCLTWVAGYSIMKSDRPVGQWGAGSTANRATGQPDKPPPGRGLDRKTELAAREEKRDQIIRAAAKVFGSKGYARTLIAEVAAEAGVGKGTVYEYFDSKTALFLAVFDWLNRRVNEAAQVAAEGSGGSAAERMRARVEAVIQGALEIWDFYGLFMEFWAASADEQFRPWLENWFKKSYAEYRRTVEELIREGMERGEFRADADPESLAVLAVGTLEGIFLQAWFDDGLDLVDLARRYVDFFIDGLSRWAGGEQ
jgi:AcrR family transcriptional regulator